MTDMTHTHTPVRPRIRGVAFDLDGLLVNTEELYQHVGTELLARRGRSRWRGRRSPAGALAWREIEGNRSHCIGQRRDHNVLVIVLRVGRADHHRKVLC